MYRYRLKHLNRIDIVLHGIVLIFRKEVVHINREKLIQKEESLYSFKFVVQMYWHINTNYVIAIIISRLQETYV